jgi:hypothetical protein
VLEPDGADARLAIELREVDVEAPLQMLEPGLQVTEREAEVGLQMKKAELWLLLGWLLMSIVP